MKPPAKLFTMWKTDPWKLRGRAVKRPGVRICAVGLDFFGLRTPGRIRGWNFLSVRTRQEKSRSSLRAARLDGAQLEGTSRLHSAVIGYIFSSGG